MVGFNLLAVGAAPEAHLGDAPVATASPSEGIDFAGVLGTMLPAGDSPKPDEAATPDAPDADALQAQFAAVGLMTLPLPLPIEPTATTDYPAQTLEPRLHTAGDARTLPTEPTLWLEPSTAAGDIPEPTTILGDGTGDIDFAETPTAASENLLAVEGDAPPVPARQAELPSPPPSTSTPTEAAYPEGVTLNTQAEATPPEEIAASPTQPYSGDSPTPTAHEPRPPRDELPTGQQEPRTLTATHTTAPAQHTPHALAAAESASPLHYAEPNWGVAEQVAQHIERMVYERERNSLTVRLDPPELGVVELRIQATGGEVQAWLSAERDLTRQMLQQAQQYLREQLESRGLNLTHFDVGAQSQFQHAPREPYTPYAAHATPTRTPTATDSLLYDGRWSVWV
jgi:flagellar hook-length control protein FliK